MGGDLGIGGLLGGQQPRGNISLFTSHRDSYSGFQLPDSPPLPQGSSLWPAKG